MLNFPSDMAEEKHPEFQVTDRRRWTAEGETRPDVDPRDTPQAVPPPLVGQPKSPAAQQPSQPPPKPAAPAPSPPPKQERVQSTLDKGGQAASSYAASGIGYEKFNFEKLIVSLAQTAMFQLGLISPDPSQRYEPDLVAARETIDILAVLQEKTRGNLSAKEEKLLENSITELRLAWVEIDRRLAKAR